MAPPRSSGFTDPGWEHGVAQDEKKKKVKCNYCGKIVSGGIYRLKQHLARISGEVTYCKKAPEEVFVKMKENLEGYRASKRQRQSEDEEHASLDLHSNDDEEDYDESADYKQEGKETSDDKSLVVSLAPLRSLGYVDPGWEHGVALDERKKKVKCNYCEKIVSGGINRFKQHLARIPGEVAYCKMAPEDVYLKMKENMKWHRTGRRRRPESKELTTLYVSSDMAAGDGDLANGRNKAKRLTGDRILAAKKGPRKRFRGRSPARSVSSLEPQLKEIKVEHALLKTQKSTTQLPHKQAKKTSNEKKGRKDVVSAICKFFYHAGVPFNAANSPYFHRMLDLVTQYGQGLKGPSSRLMSGRFLQDEVSNIKQHLVEIKTSWTVTGSTIMADSWKDMQNRTLINFLVSCPRGTFFVSSIDASEIVEDATDLFKLLDKIVEEVGEENIVQVVTESSVNFKAAGKMLEEKRKNLFWTPCAVNCIDGVLEDFVKIKLVGDCINKGQKITRFIYNHAWLLNLLKKEFTAGRELLRPAVTRTAASFVTLQNLLEHKTQLKIMFQSIKWSSSQFAKSDDGKEVEKIVQNSTFWKRMQYVKKSVDPILQVLLKVDSDKGLSMPFIYNDMHKARLAIKEIHGNEERKYGPFWTAIENHWNSLFHHPLYVAAYFLNPSFRYRADFLALPEVIRGLNDCIVRLEPDNGRRISASMQISDFVSAKDDFGTELAISTRTELDPAAWWQQHGINCLELQRIAIRILSQTCSSFGCEHTWSAFDQIHSKRRNRLAQKKFSDLTYVHYNLRLKERQLKRKSDDSMTVDNVLLEGLLDDWIVEAQKPTLQEDEEILYDELEQAEMYENEMNENEDLETETGIEPTDGAGFPEIIEPLDVRHTLACVASDDDDADLDFLDEDLSN
uniref:Anhydro-N-acetylmuramic acid kinase n=1 Tax=Anthurium amnicola TaxID=1678845 RepID=A0A1D1ZDT6_9ARAE